MSPVDSSEFFWCQSDITKAKLKLYEEYIKNYAPVLLMQYGVLFIADLFCGPWMNWTEKWSPLILIDILSELLDNPAVIKKWGWKAKVIILLNDKDKDNFNKIQSTLSTYSKNSNIRLVFRNEEFSQILKTAESELKDTWIPKFFFLDPFSYSTIKLWDIKTVFNLDITEILFFSPAFDMYRFVNAENIHQNPDHKTRKAIEDLTEEWILRDYWWIHEFCEAMVEKMKKELNEKYIRYVLLDAWKRKHALFFLTRHPLWLLKFNKAASRLGDCCWLWVNVGELMEKTTWIQSCLFSEKEQQEFNPYIQERFAKFKEILLKEITRKPLTNVEVIELCAIHDILPEDIKEYLQDSTLFTIRYIAWMWRWTYIAESNWNTVKCIFFIKK